MATLYSKIKVLDHGARLDDVAPPATLAVLLSAVGVTTLLVRVEARRNLPHTL